MFKHRVPLHDLKNSRIVWLPPQSVLCLELLICAGDKWLSTLELERAGCKHPSNAIINIKEVGAQVSTEIGGFVVEGEYRSLMARYSIAGWDWSRKSKYVVKYNG